MTFTCRYVLSLCPEIRCTTASDQARHLI